ncbi:MAG: hypothetical protein WHW07_11270, partial [Bacteroidales bacterium]
MTKVMRLLLWIVISLLPFMAFAQSGFNFCNEIESEKIDNYERIVQFLEIIIQDKNEILKLKNQIVELENK